MNFRILTMMALIFSATCIFAQDQGPLNTPRINSTYYVGSLRGLQFYPTIQSAVTDACASANRSVVDIPASYIGIDPIIIVTGGCANAVIKDEHNGLPTLCYSWNSTSYTITACNGISNGGTGATTAGGAWTNVFAGASIAASCGVLTTNSGGALTCGNYTPLNAASPVWSGLLSSSAGTLQIGTPTYTPGSGLLAGFFGSGNYATGNNIQNSSNGTSAIAIYSVGNDLDTQTAHHVDIGDTSSTWVYNISQQIIAQGSDHAFVEGRGQALDVGTDLTFPFNLIYNKTPLAALNSTGFHVLTPNFLLSGLSGLPSSSYYCLHVASTGAVAPTTADCGAGGGSGTVGSGTTNQAAIYTGSGTTVAGGTLTAAGGGTGATTAAGAQYNLALGGVGSFPVPSLVNDGSTDNTAALNAVLNPGTGYVGPVLLPSTAQLSGGVINFGANVGGFSQQIIIGQQGMGLNGIGWRWLHNSSSTAATILNYTGNGKNQYGDFLENNACVGICPLAAITITGQPPTPGSASPPPPILQNNSLRNFSLVGPNNAYGEGIELGYNSNTYSGSQFDADTIAISGFSRAIVGTWSNMHWKRVQITDGSTPGGSTTTSNSTSSDCSVDFEAANADSSDILPLDYQFENYASQNNPNNCIVNIRTGDGATINAGDIAHPNNVFKIGAWTRWVNNVTGTGTTITPTVTSGAVTSLSFSGGTNYIPDLLLSTAGCTVAPRIIMKVSAGIPIGYKIESGGSGCSSPTITVPDPNQYADATVYLTNVENRLGYESYCDTSSICHVYKSRDETYLSTVVAPHIVQTAASLDYHGVAAIGENPAAVITATPVAGSGLTSGVTYSIQYEASGVSYGPTFSTGPSSIATCNPTGSNLRCQVVTGYMGTSTQGTTATCTLYIYNGTTLAWTTATTPCGTNYTVTGSESAGSAPPVGTIPLIQVIGTPSSAWQPFSAQCPTGRLDGTYGGYGAMAYIQDGSGHSAYVNVCGSTGIYYVIGSLPTPNAFFEGVQVRTVNTSGAITGCYVYTGTAWGPNTCAVTLGTNSAPGQVQCDGTTLNCSGGVASVMGSTGGFMNAMVEWAMPGASTVFTALGTSVSNGTGSTAAITNIPSAGTAPTVLQATSDATSGHYAGWTSGVQDIYGSKWPSANFGVSYSTSTDYSANSREWFGFISSSCAPATMQASDTPSCSYAAIRWSTVAGDTAYQCVNDNSSGTPTVQAIGTQTPSTLGSSLYLVPMSVAVTSSGVTCIVNGVSVTNGTSKLPTLAHPYEWLEMNTYPGGGVTHLQSNGWFIKYQNGSY